MAALQCDICGGKLMAKAGGIFECDSCGMQYDKTRIQEMVQEIRGTVKVEGTVQVQGTVKVEGSANKDALLKRGYLALEDENWAEAIGYFDQALNADAECAEAYLGKVCAAVSCSVPSQLGQLERKEYSSLPEYIKAKRFSSQTLLAALEKVESFSEDLTRRREEEAARVEAEDREKRKAAVRLLEPVRQRNRPCAGLVALDCTALLGVGTDGKVRGKVHYQEDAEPIKAWRHICKVAVSYYQAFGLKTDGTVVSATIASSMPKYGNPLCDVSGWEDIVDIVAGDQYTAGLKSDGTVVLTMAGDRSEGALGGVKNWAGIIAIAGGNGGVEKNPHIVGLKADGTVLALGRNLHGECDVERWTGIIAIAAGDDHTVGLKADGTVVATEYRAGSGPYASYSGQCEVGSWRDIVAIAAGRRHTAGLKADGTVLVSTNDLNSMAAKWENIAAIYAGCDDLAGLTADGSVVHTFIRRFTDIYKKKEWEKAFSQKLFDSVDTLTLEQNRLKQKAAAEAAAEDAAFRAMQARQDAIEEKRRTIAALHAERARLGILAVRQKKEIDEAIAFLQEEILNI